MNVNRIIPELLIKNQEINIPELGKLKYSYLAAELYKFTNRVAPPTHKIEFNTSADENDFRLVDAYSLLYSCSRDEALESIKHWVREIKATVEKGSQFNIENLGFFINNAGRLTFNPDKNSPLFADNYGLESAKIPLLEIEEPIKEKSIVMPETNKKSITVSPMWKKIALIAAVIVILGGITYILIDSGAIKTAFKAVSNLFSKKNEHENVILNDSTEAMKRNALLYSEANKSADSTQKKVITYYIIAGSYKNRNNADKKAESLKNKGFNTEIININDTLYRLSIASFEDRRKAVEEYIALVNQDKSMKIWLYSELKR